MNKTQTNEKGLHLPSLQAIHSRTSTPGSGPRGLGSVTSQIDGACFPSGSGSERNSLRKFLNTPRSSKQQQVEHYAKEKFGRTLAHVDAIDVLRNPDLHSELAAFALNEHFDRRGAPRYRRLGLAFVAQQNPAIQSTFGSRADDTSDKAAGKKNQCESLLALRSSLGQGCGVYKEAQGRT